MIQLSTYWRSSAAYRVRIALHLKSLAFESLSIDLARGDQHSAVYRTRNPQGRIPHLVDGDVAIAQSLAIIEYLEEQYPHPALLPAGASARAQVRSFAQAIACDIHPLNNLAVQRYLKEQMGQSQPAIMDWYAHWIVAVFAGLETVVEGPFVFGETPTLADICLVPQLYNARRFEVDVAAFPRLLAADAHARSHPAFVAALPENQPDAP